MQTKRNIYSLTSACHRIMYCHLCIYEMLCECTSWPKHTSKSLCNV